MYHHAYWITVCKLFALENKHKIEKMSVPLYRTFKLITVSVSLHIVNANIKVLQYVPIYWLRGQL